jgi:hypothetical protein
MPRRARHESSDIHRERLKDLRVRRHTDIEQRKRKVRERWYRWNTLDRYFNEYINLIEMNPYLKEFVRGFMRKYMRNYSRMMDDIEKMTLLMDTVRHRAVTMFKIVHDPKDVEKDKMYVLDETLLSLPPEDMHFVINRLIQVTKGNPITREEMMTNPILKYFAERYILMYMEYPCSHNAYAMKLTPLTLYYANGYYQRYYVMRWMYAK